MSLKLIPAPCVDPRQEPYVHISGPVESIYAKDDTFDINARQYAMQIPKGTASVLPVKIHIANSPRWESRAKPMPKSLGTYVYVEGIITGMDAARMGESGPGGELQYLTVGLSNIAFLGRVQPQLPLFSA